MKFHFKDSGKLYVPKGKKAKGTETLHLFHNDGESAAHNDNIRFKNHNSEPDNKRQAASVSQSDIDQEPSFREENGIYYFEYRQISKAIVGSGTWKATDFTKGNILRDSVPLFEGVPAYKNHSYWVGNGIGRVKNPKWLNAYTNSLGQMIPAGIDAEFGIDSSVPSREDLIADLKSLVNPYNACSIGVDFDWEASHEFEDMYDFYRMLGTIIIDEDGNESQVRRIVTLITRVFESSLVAFGADMYARQKSKSGEVKYSHTDMIGSFDLDTDPMAEIYKQTGSFYVFTGAKPSKICESGNKKINLHKEAEQEADNKPSNMRKELVKFMLVVFGVSSVEDITDEMLEQSKEMTVEGYGKLSDASKTADEKLIIKSGELEKLESDYEKIKSESDKFKSDYETKVIELDTALKEKKDVDSELTALKESATYSDFGKDSHSEMVEGTKAAYRSFCLAQDESPKESILKEIEETKSFAALKDKASLYGSKIGFSGECTDCGGTNVKFRSTTPDKSHEDKTEGDFNGEFKPWKIAASLK